MRFRYGTPLGGGREVLEVEYKILRLGPVPRYVGSRKSAAQEQEQESSVAIYKA